MSQIQSTLWVNLSCLEKPDGKTTAMLMEIRKPNVWRLQIKGSLRWVLKYFSSLATPLASLWLTYKVFCKVHPAKRTEMEDTRTVLGQTKGQSSLITCLLHYLRVAECAIPEQTQLQNSQPEQRHVRNHLAVHAAVNRDQRWMPRERHKNKVVLHPVHVRGACS